MSGRGASRGERSGVGGRAPGLWLVALMLCVSGGSALVFQVAWMRELRLVFGATTAAVAAVLAVFMAGLGLGSAVLGRRADRTANPLRMYGQLEIAVALMVALSPYLIGLAAKIYFGLGGQGTLGLGGATVVRLALAVAVMGVPTFFMGGTLPAAARSITAAGDVRRRALAVLYGVNTLGAVCGAYFATFYALETLGTHATLWLGCAMNLLVGLIAVRSSKSLPALEPREEVAAEPAALALELDHVLVYAAAGVLGFVFFSLELVWYRMLAPILGGTTFTFGLILCVALFGIGVGGAAYNWVFRWVSPSWSVLALSCAVEAALAALPLALGDRLAILAGRLFIQATSFGQVVVGWCLVMSIVVLPVALVSGLQFPLLVALLGEGRTAVSRQLGTAYAWNTVGAIAGSLVGGFVAIPLLTAVGAWRALVVLLVLLSAGLIVRAGSRAGRTAYVVVGVLLFTLACAWQRGPTSLWRHSGIGAGRAIVPPRSNANATQMWINEHRRSMQWEAEGIESSIAITSPDGLSFVVNGKNDGNAIGDAGTQIGVSILGAVLHPAPKTGLVIGLGTGESAGWLAEMPGIERVDVVELEPAIDEMARRSSQLNKDVLNHPRVRRIYNDGREFVFTTDQKYDVIISEPSNPYRAGVAALYTLEFYQQVRDRLTAEGVFVQWVQAYEVDSLTVSTVLATARRVFQHVELWQSIPSDLQVVCSQVPIKYSVEEMRTRLGTPIMAEALRVAWKVDGVEGFLAHYLGNTAYVDGVESASVILPNTDDRNFLEYGFAKTVGFLTGFTASDMREAAVLAGHHRPVLTEGGIDWELVERRRIEFNFLFTGQILPSQQRTPELRALAQGYVYFLGG